MNQNNQESQGTAEDKNILSTQWHSAKQHQGTKNTKTKRRQCEIDWILICLCFITSFVSTHLANRTQVRANQPSTGARICIGGFASLNCGDDFELEGGKGQENPHMFHTSGQIIIFHHPRFP